MAENKIIYLILFRGVSFYRSRIKGCVEKFNMSTTLAAVPMMAKNFEPISEMISDRKFNIADCEVNVFCTLANKFKTHYSLEKINWLVLKTISEFKVLDKECVYCVDDMTFTIIPYFTYAKRSIDEENFIVHEPVELFCEPTDILMPDVIGVTLFVFFNKIDEQNIDSAQKLLDNISRELLLKVNLYSDKKSLHFNTKSEKTKKKLVDTISGEFQKHGNPLEDYSTNKNELKIPCSTLVSYMLKEIFPSSIDNSAETEPILE